MNFKTIFRQYLNCHYFVKSHLSSHCSHAIIQSHETELFTAITKDADKSMDPIQTVSSLTFEVSSDPPAQLPHSFQLLQSFLEPVENSNIIKNI